MYKIDAQEKLQQIMITSIPHMKQPDAQDVINNYKRISSDIIEVLEDYTDYSNIDKLRTRL